MATIGGTGLRRFARIYQRKEPAKDGTIPVPIACIADMDVMPDCRLEITKRVELGAEWRSNESGAWEFIAEHI